MNIVGIRTDNNKVFESNSVNPEIENPAEQVETAIKNDAASTGVEIRIEQMTDEELQTYIASH